MSENNLVLGFEFIFEKETNYEVFFSFCFPYPYQKSLNLIRELSKKYQKDPDIYFNKETLAFSP